MAKRRSVSLRKEPVQQRALALRTAIVEAAAYILKHEGPGKFTTNRIAERAGANIASLYQYYRNKEAILFHLVEIEWNKTYQSVYPILLNQKLSRRKRLNLFTQKFFEHEAEDGNLKTAITQVGFLVEDTPEYRALLVRGNKVFFEFLNLNSASSSSIKREADAEFIQHLITSFSENKKTSNWKTLESDARRISDMICDHFLIGE